MLAQVKTASIYLFFCIAWDLQSYVPVLCIYDNNMHAIFVSLCCVGSIKSNI